MKFQIILALTVVASLMKQSFCSEDEARRWLEEFEVKAEQALSEYSFADWDYNTNLTDSNLKRSVEKATEYATFNKEQGLEANTFDWKQFTDKKLQRIFSKIANIGPSVLPEDEFKKMAQLNSEMQEIYSKAKVGNKPGDSSGKYYPLDPDLTEIMATSNNTDELLWAWEGWRNVSGRLLPDKYEEFVKLINNASRMNGFDNNGEYWMSLYETATFREDCENLWQQIKPLYEELHAYTRRKLKEKYPHVHFPSQGHIPAHLLGNMWAQLWDSKGDLLRPAPDVRGMDVTDELIKQNYTVLKIVKLAESFFTSLGLPAMPEPFWEKSLFLKPSDRDVVCHASAWDFYNKRDFRIKQCTEVNMEWLFVTHHEMGHIEYYINYKDQPISFRSGANSGFHEAIGDVMSLSVATPEHLQIIGLLPNFIDNPNADLNFLMQQALSKIAFIPFGYLIDQWRWDVFAGKTNKSDYNRHWWNARCKYQGIFPPVARSDQDFDPGAKYHVANNIEYIRYFVAHILQFQIHEALCKAANNTKPLHRCSIYNSKEAGAKLKRLLEKGSSEPWHEILKELTGTEKMSATSLVNYFQPLHEWLKEQNKGQPVGWEEACPPGSFH